MKGRNACLVAAAVWLASAGALRAQRNQVRDRDPSWQAPAAESSKSNPLAAREPIVAGGRKLYGQRCQTCHGQEGSGTSRAPSLIAPGVQAQSDGAIFWKITTGNAYAGMPSFSFLPESQRWQVVLHLRGLARDAL